MGNTNMTPSMQEAILGALPYPAMIIDSSYKILTANLPAERLLEGSINNVDFIRVLRQPEAKDCITRAMEDPGLQTVDIILNLKTPRTYKVTATYLSSEGMTSGLLLFTMLDVSAEIDAERSRSTFVSNVSHELRSPLTAMKGIVETLQGPAKNDETGRDRFLNLMQSEIERMSRLVGDLLSLAKLEAREHLPPRGEVDILNVLNRVRSSLSVSQEEYVDRIKIDAPDSIPLVQGNRDELTEVFQNLVENALKYSGAGEPVEIEVSHVDNGDANNSRVIVRVCDYGDGIAPEHLPRLTERFYRVDKGRSREKGGTGLGLAITKHILNRHRAKLQVSSELDKGTCFTVIFRNEPRLQ